MSYQVLARKWRPRSFKDLVGQGHVLKVLINALDSGRLHHAYLFTGTRGVGKTTLARILAKCLNCEAGVSSTPCGECGACVGIDEGRFVDLIEVDAASRAKVDETRELMDNVQYSPTAGRHKVYLIDEVHMFSKHSFNALLKTLEEPPPHVKFLLATTEPKRIPITILSRCLQFNLKHLTMEEIEGQLQTIMEAENVPAEGASAALLAAAADGSMRDALSLLDQAISYGNGRLEEAQMRDMLGAIDSNELKGLLDDIIRRDAGGLFARINKVAELTPDYDALLAELLSILHDTAVAQALPKTPELAGETAAGFASRLKKEDVQLYYQIALNGRRDLHMAPDQKMGFEMTLIRMLAFRPLQDAASPASGAGRGAASGGEKAPRLAEAAPPAVPVAPAPSAAATEAAPPAAPVAPVAHAPSVAAAEAAPPAPPVAPAPSAAATETAPPAAPVAPAPSAAAVETPPPAPPVAPAPSAAVAEVAPLAPPPAREKRPMSALSNDNWPALIDEMALTGLTRELARHCVLKNCNGNQVSLSLQSGQRHLLSPAQQEHLQDALRRRFDGGLRLLFEEEEGDAAETPAQKQARASREEKQAAIRAIEDDPKVKTLQEAFGATIDAASARLHS